ncbi:predicted protein [Uncinocarpus reesii 1704]|uniref:RING-type E3 ubiquitin transferase n=1 Tax=Uncinocarpus reesii (strain UAMH 1704) TaxID=336963 RepID=C4JX27_UNCRE|nr:uncharacterized protein UREG_06200 [Uncinocarpus reesii 1704]EEP81335.1 predicted protein [Uncinocarpus reesii 1704]
MECDGDLRREIFQKTLTEVAGEAADDNAHPCVICLEQVRDVGVTIPCKHGSFDFLCLVSWLQQRRACPLCQAEVTGVKYNFQSPSGPEVFSLPCLSEPRRQTARPPSERQTPRFRANRPNTRVSNRGPPSQPRDDPLARRRYIYQRQLYSQRVGSNRLSQYRELTPQLFNKDENLVSRARKWIRRELQVFAFLDPNNQGLHGGREQQAETATGGDDAGRIRRARNAEFLLEYIIAILRTVDIKGSGGQAEELLQEFIGRDNAQLFLHELQAWLRSPFDSLQDWDRGVQYDEYSQPSLPTLHRREVESPPANRSSAQWRPDGAYRSEPRGVRKHRTRGHAPNFVQGRRIERAKRRYRPD